MGPALGLMGTLIPLSLDLTEALTGKETATPRTRPADAVIANKDQQTRRSSSNQANESSAGVSQWAPFTASTTAARSSSENRRAAQGSTTTMVCAPRSWGAGGPQPSGMASLIARPFTMQPGPSGPVVSPRWPTSPQPPQ